MRKIRSSGGEEIREKEDTTTGTDAERKEPKNWIIYYL